MDNSCFGDINGRKSFVYFDRSLPLVQSSIKGYFDDSVWSSVSCKRLLCEESKVEAPRTHFIKISQKKLFEAKIDPLEFPMLSQCFRFMADYSRLCLHSSCLMSFVFCINFLNFLHFNIFSYYTFLGFLGILDF